MHSQLNTIGQSKSSCFVFCTGKRFCSHSETYTTFTASQLFKRPLPSSIQLSSIGGQQKTYQQAPRIASRNFAFQAGTPISLRLKSTIRDVGHVELKETHSALWMNSLYCCNARHRVSSADPLTRRPSDHRQFPNIAQDSATRAHDSCVHKFVSSYSRLEISLAKVCADSPAVLRSPVVLDMATGSHPFLKKLLLH